MIHKRKICCIIYLVILQEFVKNLKECSLSPFLFFCFSCATGATIIYDNNATIEVVYTWSYKILCIAIFRPKSSVNTIVLNVSSFTIARTHKVCEVNRFAPGFDVRQEDRTGGSINRRPLYGAIDLGRLFPGTGI